LLRIKKTFSLFHIMLLKLLICICSVSIVILLFNKNAAEPWLIGDLNGDNAIDTLDYSLMKQSLLNSSISLPIKDPMYAADLDSDGSITVLDLSLLKQYLLVLPLIWLTVFI
jgi:hypothetical protein